MDDHPQGNVGPSTDRNNEPVVDPTKNVLDLVQAAIQRQDDLRKVEAEATQERIKGLQGLTDSRFQSIDEQLAIIESRRVEQKIDTKVAVDAALSAAEKAVKEQTTASEKAITKSETSAAEQSKQQNATFTAALKGVSDVLADLKDRVVKIESYRINSRESLFDRGQGANIQGALWGTVVAVIAILVTIVVATHGFTK